MAKMNRYGVITVVIALVFSAACHHRVESPFNDLKIVFFAGGSQHQAFSETVARGAVDMGELLKCDVDIVWSDWDPDLMVRQFKEVIHEKPDAICVMGHPGEQKMYPLFVEAKRKGIVVTIGNVDLPNIREDFLVNGCGYTGQNTYESGYQLGRALGIKYADRKPMSALVFTWDYDPEQKLSNRAKRSQGVIDGLNEKGMTVNFIDMPDAIISDMTPESFAVFLKESLTEYPDTAIVVTDGGDQTAILSDTMKTLGINPGEVVGAGFDLSENVIRGLQQGYIGMVHDQQPYLQGALPVLQACLTCKYGFSGLEINTGSGLIDETTADLPALSKLVVQRIR